jgi:hypothetical protein
MLNGTGATWKRITRRFSWVFPFSLATALLPILPCYTYGGVNDAPADSTVATEATRNLSATPATEKENVIDADREVLHQLLEQINELEARVRELEAKEPISSSAPTPAPAASAAPIPAKPDPPAAVPAALPPQVDLNEVAPRLHLNSYGDVGYSANDQAKGANSFQVGSFDLFLTSRMSDRASVLGEVIFFAHSDNKIEPDLERMLFQFKFNDYFTFGVGRYHTDIGYYNATFHHIQWFATPIGRPLMFRFDDDGGYMPLQEIGLTMNGNIPSGKLGLHYVAEVGNGRAHSPGEEPAQNRIDDNHGKSSNVNLSAHPAWIPGLITGFSFYHDDVTPFGSAKISQSIMDAYFVYQIKKVEWLNEAMQVRNAPFGGRVFHIPGFYSQLSYGIGKYRPYFRYAWENANDLDPLFNANFGDVFVSRKNDAAFGVRYDVNSFGAFKLQYDRFSQRNLSSYNALSSQFSFSF